MWGTARDLRARFEVGRGSGDLAAIFEVGQDSRDLPTGLLIRDAALTDLYAKFVAIHSQTLLGRASIRHSDSLDLPSGAGVRSVGSADLQGAAYVRHSVALYCKFEVGQNIADLLARTEIRESDSAELFGRIDVYHSVELLGKGEIQQSDSAGSFARFEIGQDARDLLARIEVGQGSVDLLGQCDVRQSSSASLLAKLSIPASVDLFARFRPAQEVLNLSGRLVVRHPAFPVQLGAIFSFGLTNTYLDLRSMLEMGHSSYSEALGRVTIRHVGAPVELSGMCWVPYLAAAELLGGMIVRNVGSVELPGRFGIQGLGDLYAKFTIAASDSVMLIGDDDLASLLNYLAEVGEGFIGTPTAENDPSEKRIGADSFRITSAYVAGGGKEVIFGTLQASPLFNFSHSEGIAFYWWGSGGVDQQINFEMKSTTGSWVGKFYDGPAAWRWVFLSWDDLVEIDLDGTRPDVSDVTGFYWTYHTDGVRRVDYIVGWRRQDLRGDFGVRHVGTTIELLGRAEVGQGSADLGASFRLPQEVVFAKFVVRQIGSVEVFAESTIRHLDSVDLTAEIEIAHWRDFFARFGVNQDAGDLACGFEVGQNSADFLARFGVNQDARDLACRFELIGVLWIAMPEDDCYANLVAPDAIHNGTKMWCTNYTSSRHRIPYLKFDISALAGRTIVSAKLYLYQDDYVAPGWGRGDVSAYRVADDTWVEESLTWNNRPALGALIGMVNCGASDTWYAWDVKTYLEDELSAAEDLISFGLDRTHLPDWSRFNSKEFDGFDSYLKVIYI